MTRAVGGLVAGLLVGGLASFAAPGWVAVLIAMACASMGVLATPAPAREEGSDLDALLDATQAFGRGDRFARARVPATSLVAPLGAAFDAMADRISAMMESREELLAAVAHELRTPLNRLRFGIELLVDLDDAPHREARAQALQADIEELDDLVRELLTWGRLDSVRGALHTEPVDLAALAERLADDARALGAREVDIDVEPGLRLRAEPRLVRRAWRNGVTNAVRYGHGRVALGAAQQVGGVHLWVDDDGPGVPVGQREAVFDPFVRLDSSRSSSTGGTGLGLALVARIATAHRGQASMEDGPLGGARLRIVFPS